MDRDDTYSETRGSGAAGGLLFGNAALLVETNGSGTERDTETREEHVNIQKAFVSPALFIFGAQRHCFSSPMQVSYHTVPLPEPVEFRFLSLATKDVVTFRRFDI